MLMEGYTRFCQKGGMKEIYHMELKYMNDLMYLTIPEIFSNAKFKGYRN